MKSTRYFISSNNILKNKATYGLFVKNPTLLDIYLRMMERIKLLDKTIKKNESINSSKINGEVLNRAEKSRKYFSVY